VHYPSPIIATSAKDDILLRCFPDLDKPLATLRISPSHTQSARTRPPGLYDRHLRDEFQLRRLDFDPALIPGLVCLVSDKFSKRKLLNKHVKAGKAVERAQRARYAFLQTSGRRAVDEMSVLQACIAAMEGATLISTLVCFDLNDKELADEPGDPLFVIHSSSEPDTKADTLVSLELDNIIHDKGLYTKLLGLSDMGPFLGLEAKNIVAADPRIYLGLLLFSAVCYEDPTAVFPWPTLTCAGCNHYERIHSEMQMRSRRTSVPRDAADRGASPLLHEALQEQITSVKAYIEQWDEYVGQKRSKGSECGRRTRAATPFGDSEDFSKTLDNVIEDFGRMLSPLSEEVAIGGGSPSKLAGGHLYRSNSVPFEDRDTLQGVMTVIDRTCDKYGIDEGLRRQVRRWIANAAWITVQVCL
jgi:hypothetical protein